MRDTTAALAELLQARGRFAVVSGRQSPGLAPLIDAASVAVVAPGPSTRLQVAEGLGLGGHHVITVLDELPPGVKPDPSALSVTTNAACARDALQVGWSVVQPWAAADVAPLLESADGSPTMVLLGEEPTLEFEDPPAPRRTRLWIDGDLATIVASGAAVPTSVRLAERLQDRGVDIAAVEVGVLTSPDQVPLVAGSGLLVAGRDTVAALRAPAWPDVRTIPVWLDGKEEADLIGAILAVVPA
jgi:hypothetical protein